MSNLFSFGQSSQETDETNETAPFCQTDSDSETVIMSDVSVFQTTSGSLQDDIICVSDSDSDSIFSHFNAQTNHKTKKTSTKASSSKEVSSPNKEQLIINETARSLLSQKFETKCKSKNSTLVTKPNVSKETISPKQENSSIIKKDPSVSHWPIFSEYVQNNSQSKLNKKKGSRLKKQTNVKSNLKVAKSYRQRLVQSWNGRERKNCSQPAISDPSTSADGSSSLEIDQVESWSESDSDFETSPIQQKKLVSQKNSSKSTGNSSQILSPILSRKRIKNRTDDSLVKTKIISVSMNVQNERKINSSPALMFTESDEEKISELQSPQENSSRRRDSSSPTLIPESDDEASQPLPELLPKTVHKHLPTLDSDEETQQPDYSDDEINHNIFKSQVVGKNNHESSVVRNVPLQDSADESTQEPDSMSEVSPNVARKLSDSLHSDSSDELPDCDFLTQPFEVKSSDVSAAKDKMDKTPTDANISYAVPISSSVLTHSTHYVKFDSKGKSNLYFPSKNNQTEISSPQVKLSNNNLSTLISEIKENDNVKKSTQPLSKAQPFSLSPLKSQNISASPNIFEKMAASSQALLKDSQFHSDVEMDEFIIVPVLKLGNSGSVNDNSAPFSDNKDTDDSSDDKIAGDGNPCLGTVEFKHPETFKDKSDKSTKNSVNFGAVEVKEEVDNGWSYTQDDNDDDVVEIFDSDDEDALFCLSQVPVNIKSEPESEEDGEVVGDDEFGAMAKLYDNEEDEFEQPKLKQTKFDSSSKQTIVEAAAPVDKDVDLFDSYFQDDFTDDEEKAMEEGKDADENESDEFSDEDIFNQSTTNLCDKIKFDESENEKEKQTKHIATGANTCFKEKNILPVSKQSSEINLDLIPDIQSIDKDGIKLSEEMEDISSREIDNNLTFINDFFDDFGDSFPKKIDELKLKCDDVDKCVMGPPTIVTPDQDVTSDSITTNISPILNKPETTSDDEIYNNLTQIDGFHSPGHVTLYKSDEEDRGTSTSSKTNFKRRKKLLSESSIESAFDDKGNNCIDISDDEIYYASTQLITDITEPSTSSDDLGVIEDLLAKGKTFNKSKSVTSNKPKQIIQIDPQRQESKKEIRDKYKRTKEMNISNSGKLSSDSKSTSSSITALSSKSTDKRSTSNKPSSCSHSNQSSSSKPCSSNKPSSSSKPMLSSKPSTDNSTSSNKPSQYSNSASSTKPSSNSKQPISAQNISNEQLDPTVKNPTKSKNSSSKKSVSRFLSKSKPHSTISISKKNSTSLTTHQSSSWLNKNHQVPCISTKKKKSATKSLKSVNEPFSLTQKITTAREQLKHRKYQPKAPEGAIAKYNNTRDEMENLTCSDVQLPDVNDILNKQLPILSCNVNEIRRGIELENAENFPKEPSAAREDLGNNEVSSMKAKSLPNKPETVIADPYAEASTSVCALTDQNKSVEKNETLVRHSVNEVNKNKRQKTLDSDNERELTKNAEEIVPAKKKKECIEVIGIKKNRTAGKEKVNTATTTAKDSVLLDELIDKMGPINQPTHLPFQRKVAVSKQSSSSTISSAASVRKPLDSSSSIPLQPKGDPRKQKHALHSTSAASSGLPAPSVNLMLKNNQQPRHPLSTYNAVSSHTVSNTVLSKPTVQEKTKVNKIFKLDDYYRIILRWNPVWLDEQDNAKNNGQPPPLLGKANVFQLLESYTNIQEYQEIMLNLLALETWEMITRDWKEKHHKQKSDDFQIGLESIQTEEEFIRFVWLGILSPNVFESGNYPREMDLVRIDMFGVFIQECNKGNKKTPQSSCYPQMAFVEKVTVHKNQEAGAIIKRVKALEKHPLIKGRTLITMKIITKVKYRKFSPDGSKLMKLEVLSSLVTNQRQISALAYFPRNPLHKDILKPGNKQIYSHHRTNHLLTGFDVSQSQAISSISQAVKQPVICPKICILQGPPGTGKSHTIVGFLNAIIKSDRTRGCVCLATPSNGAADELMRRLIRDNRNTKENNKDKLRVVRVGNSSSVHPDVRSHCWDVLTNNKRKSVLREKQKQNIPDSVQQDMKRLEERIDKFKKELETCRKAKDDLKAGKCQVDLNKLVNQQRNLEKQFTNSLNKDITLTGQEEFMIKSDILLHADVVCGTLSSFGSQRLLDILRNGRSANRREHFTCLIIDEASQASELDCLIPLQYGVKKIVLVGDPEQLPATVLSKKAGEMNFGQSLLERLYNYFKHNDEQAICMLKTQYRMDSTIFSFPNKLIYNDELNTHKSVQQNSEKFPLIPYLVFDMVCGKETANAESICNTVEAQCTVELCQNIVRRAKLSQSSIGVICPYQSQKALVLEGLKNSNLNSIEVGTVDGFQGREKPVIILNCVRSQSASGGIGFLADRRRMNVAITRAKSALYILGNLNSLKKSGDWRLLIEDAVSRRRVISVNKIADFCRQTDECFKRRTQTKT
ncbi:hypothetical protein SNE40_009452 [Patella caerulea]|uniref:AAA+ ATPase domain-containing protein n=1 Tax=Patella caerulea TaxID=87958 RepID=A0AAN8PYG3_PATCE